MKARQNAASSFSCGIKTTRSVQESYRITTNLIVVILLAYSFSHELLHTEQGIHSRKEVFQPHLPVRLPCYDLVPIASLTLDGSPQKGQAAGFGRYPLS